MFTVSPRVLNMLDWIWCPQRCPRAIVRTSANCNQQGGRTCAQYLSAQAEVFLARGLNKTHFIDGGIRFNLYHPIPFGKITVCHRKVPFCLICLVYVEFTYQQWWLSKAISAVSYYTAGWKYQRNYYVNIMIIENLRCAMTQQWKNDETWRNQW